MKVVLIATGYVSAMEPLVQHRPTPLLKIVDKPLLYHIIECLVERGFHDFDIILNHLPQHIEERIQEGKRWGVSFTFHLARSQKAPFDCLRPVAQAWGDEHVLIGRADVLPKLDCDVLDQLQATSTALSFFPNQQWAGWCTMPASALANLPPNTHEDDLPTIFAASGKKIIVQPFLSTRSYTDLVYSNFQLITSVTTDSLMPSTAHEVEKGIWISHGVSLERDVMIEPPVFIGENCQIKDGVTIGPHTVIENNCIIGSGSVVQRSLICQKSYVGEGLDIQDSIVDRNLLIHLKHETSIIVRDDFILSELSPAPLLGYVYTSGEQALAACLLLLFSPFYLYMKAICPQTAVEMLQLPATLDNQQWQTFTWKSFVPRNRFETFFQRLPVLINILKGDVHFVGVSPYTKNDVNRLPGDWKKLYLQSKVGLITLADLDSENPQDPSSLYAAESYYATHMSFLYDFTLFLRWLKRKLVFR